MNDIRSRREKLEEFRKNRNSQLTPEDQRKMMDEFLKKIIDHSKASFPNAASLNDREEDEEA